MSFWTRFVGSLPGDSMRVGCKQCAERTEAETLREKSLKDECRRLAEKLGKANALVNQHEATNAALNGIIRVELPAKDEQIDLLEGQLREAHEENRGLQAVIWEQERELGRGEPA